jgi:cytochrome P450
MFLQAEVDEVMGDAEAPTLEHFRRLPYVMRCINESMRLYPHPPVLLRRAIRDDELPGGHSVPAGQDMMISVYNLHRSAAVWDEPDSFRPERFGPLDGPVPNELNTNFRCGSCGVRCMAWAVLQHRAGAWRGPVAALHAAMAAFGARLLPPAHGDEHPEKLRTRLVSGAIICALWLVGTSLSVVARASVWVTNLP